jgi:23S rRNA pseudouridine2605 synthase
MTFKDKPKRGAGKPFDRETKPRAGAKPGPAGKKRPDFKAGAEKPSRKPAAVAPTVAEEGKPERISKILARAGVASRRDVERMIMEGRVKLNGTILETPVVNATLDDKIEVDGEPIRGIERTRLWLYHKPAGLVTTNSDPEGRPTVFDNLPDNLPRVLSIGRLDINTEGLLLLTNDGGLSRVLELPTTGWLRRYRVRAHGEVDQEALDKLKEGIAVEGVLYGSIEATLDRQQGRNVWITMGLREGKNREIKNVLGALGLEVNRLIRISYGPFQLGDLPEGEVLEVRGRTLRDQLGPRLIEDSKANFDAPLYNERVEDEEKPVRAQKADWAGKPDRSGGGRSDERRANALGRLDTKRDDDRFSDKPRGGADRKSGGKPGAKFGGQFGGKAGGRAGDRDFGDDRPRKRPPAGTSRTANVWMAPGARPTADGKAKKFSARADAEHLFKRPAAESDRRVVVKRAEEDSDWIRADAPARPEKGDFGRKGSFGDRPDRGDRRFGDRPPRGDRNPRDEGNRPRGERSFDKPRFEKSRDDGDRPRGEKPFGGKPFGDKPRGKPAGGRGKPSGGKSFGSKPEGGRPGGKSFGGRPGGGKPSGGKPSGGGRPGGARTSGKPRTPRG